MSADKRETKTEEKAKTFAELIKEQEDFQNRMTWKEGDLVFLKSDPREKPKKATGARLDGAGQGGSPNA